MRLSCYEITVEDENKEDISVYVSENLSSSMNADAAHVLAKLITTQAGGIFMWASLQIEKALELELEGASLAKIEAVIGSTPPYLHNLSMVEFLLEHGADITTKDEDNDTALEVADRNGQYYVV
ncbi:hypothetical protein PWT90_03551 [Aphanocladium album]|nr:hypothetical protein PWT90_03551 [Aphanocladium album]